MTTWYFQLVVSDPDGTQFGGDQVLTTAGPPPTVQTLPATNFFPCIDCAPEVQFNATVNGNGQPIAGYFQYGLTSGYDSDTRNNHFFSYYNYYATQSYATVLSFFYFIPGATCHYRAVAFNLSGESAGNDETFVAT